MFRALGGGPRQTLHILERSYLSAGLGMPPSSPREAGGGWRGRSGNPRLGCCPHNADKWEKMDGNVWQRLSGDLITFTHHAPQLLALRHLSFMAAGPACFFFTIISFTAGRATEGWSWEGGHVPNCLDAVPGGAGYSPHYFPCVLLFCVQCKYYTFLLTVEERSMDPQQCVCVPWGLQTNLNNFLGDLFIIHFSSVWYLGSVLFLLQLTTVWRPWWAAHGGSALYHQQTQL